MNVPPGHSVRTGLVLVAALVAVAAGCKSSEPRPASDSAGEGATRAPDPVHPCGAAEPVVASSPIAASAAAAGEFAVLDGVAVDRIDHPPERTIELYPRILAQQLGRQLVESGHFAADEAGVPAGRRARRATLRLSLGYTLGEPVGRARRRLAYEGVGRIESLLEWSDPDGPISPAFILVGEFEIARRQRGQVDGAVAGYMAELVGELGRDLIARERIRTGGREALVSALKNPDTSLVLWALDLIAERRETALFDPVVASLAAEEHDIRDRSLTALVALGDPRAVDALAKRASFDELDFLSDVIEAAFALGGDDAREYLEFVASGHPDEDIQRLAGEGLKRLPGARSRP